MNPLMNLSVEEFAKATKLPTRDVLDLISSGKIKAEQKGDSWVIPRSEFRRYVSEHQPSELRCSFCRKRQDEVYKLIAGPGVYICDECILLCIQILAAEAAPTLRVEVIRDEGTNKLYEFSIDTSDSGSPRMVVHRCQKCGTYLVIYTQADEDRMPELFEKHTCPS